MRNILTVAAFLLVSALLTSPAYGTAYYVDSVNGSDSNNGTSPSTPWRNLTKVEAVALAGGDSVNLQGTFTSTLHINYSGIVVQGYGSGGVFDLTSQPFHGTGTDGRLVNFGSCIRVNGSYVTVQSLNFWHTPSCPNDNYPAPDGGWTVWYMGAVHLSRGYANNIVRSCNFQDCVLPVRINSDYSQVSWNVIGGCARPMKVPTTAHPMGFGPVGITIGATGANCTGNNIQHMAVWDQTWYSWGFSYNNGWGGGAFEVDDTRYAKHGLWIFGNFCQHNCGFIECCFDDGFTSGDQGELFSDWTIAYNISDDYQGFGKTRYAKRVNFDNNTILQRSNIGTTRNSTFYSAEQNVFCFKGANRGNHVVNSLMWCKFWNGKVIYKNADGAAATTKLNNLYRDKGSMASGSEGYGTSASFPTTDAQVAFYNVAADGDPNGYRINTGSWAYNTGYGTTYGIDYFGTSVPQFDVVDRGACERPF